MSLGRITCFLALGFTAGLLFTHDAEAQYPPPGGPPPPGYGPPPPGYGPPPGGPPPPGYGPPGYGPPPPGYGPPPGPPGKKVSTGLEMATLYSTAVAWGVGTGIWIDAEADITDPGIMLIPPLIIGAAAPVGVFLIDRFAFRKGMPEGMPSAIAAGLIAGAGEGLGIASYQWVSSDAEDEWGFRGLARAEVIGATAGAGAGVGLYYLAKPVPETNILIASSTFWGAGIGTFFGGGASNGDWGESNDTVSLGGLIGFNVALAGAVTSSFFWTPSWNQIGWMWGGFAIGAAASTPVYIFYAAAEDEDPRRGLIFQGVAGTIGLTLGAIFGKPRKNVSRYGALDDSFGEGEEEKNEDGDPPWIRVYGGGPMAVEGGMGLQLNGTLW